MTVNARTAAEAFADAWEILLSSTPGWWGERHPDIVGGITGVRLPTLNGAWAYGSRAEASAIEELLARVAATGLPYCLQAADEVGRAPDLAAARGLEPEAPVPLMVLDEPAAVTAPAPPGLSIRELSPDRHREHSSLAAAGFEVAAEYFDQLVSPELARLPGLRAYIGEVDGEPVTTGVGFTHGDWVGVFNIATPPGHRRRGYGGAVTMHAIRGGLDEGASWAWLQASPAGQPVYEQLGFRTVSRWGCWVSTGG